MKSFLLAISLSALLLCSARTSTAQDTSEPENADQSVDKFLAQLDFREGEFKLSGAKVTLNVNGGFHYLDATDSRKVLEDLWGNPPDESVLGMLVPDDAGLVGEHSWAVVLTYSDDGYVSDDDASAIDYSDLLRDMQQQTSDANEWREKEGYGRLDLIGWAAPPRYDAANQKLHWAKELAFQGSAEHTLNYDVRALGRSGYLSMNAVAGIGELERVKSGMDQVMQMASFDSGQRYADFNSSSDKVAGYGLAALVGGAVAAKTGLLAKLLAALLAAKKLVFIGLAALAVAAKSWFGKKKDPQ